MSQHLSSLTSHSLVFVWPSKPQRIYYIILFQRWLLGCLGMSCSLDLPIHSPRLSFSEPPTIPQWKSFPNPGASEHGLWVRHPYSYDFPVKFKGQLLKVDEALSLDFFIISVRIDLVLSDKGLGQNRFCCLKAATNSPRPVLPPSLLYVNISSASRCNLALLFLMSTLHVPWKIMYFNLPHFKTDPGLFSLNSSPEAGCYSWVNMQMWVIQNQLCKEAKRVHSRKAASLASAFLESASSFWNHQ